MLHELADIGQRVLPLRFGQLPLPRMHRAENNTVLDRPEQFLVRFEEGLKPVKIGRRDSQGGGIRPGAPAACAVAGVVPQYEKKSC